MGNGGKQGRGPHRETLANLALSDNSLGNFMKYLCGETSWKVRLVVAGSTVCYCASVCNLVIWLVSLKKAEQITQTFIPVDEIRLLLRSYSHTIHEVLTINIRQVKLRKVSVLVTLTACAAH